jgi:hypothetical protein
MQYLLVVLLVFATACAGGDTQTFTGTITDEMCADGNHAHMQMGPTDAECTTACVLAHGARYVLYDGERAYVLSDQETPEQFAAQTVHVIGRLDAATMTIQVESMTAAR